jgi:hypothetical protein
LARPLPTGFLLEGNQYLAGLSRQNCRWRAANPAKPRPPLDSITAGRGDLYTIPFYLHISGIDLASVLLRIVILGDISMQTTSLPDRQARASDLDLVDRYWRAANYLSVGQIYLLDNPLLHEPLQPEHIKPRLLGHWGTTPGLNFIYAHLNRAICASDLNVIYVCGPGHGGPGMVANTYLEGTYSEIYPDISRDRDGLRRLFRQFSFPEPRGSGNAGINP